VKKKLEDDFQFSIDWKKKIIQTSFFSLALINGSPTSSNKLLSLLWISGHEAHHLLLFQQLWMILCKLSRDGSTLCDRLELYVHYTFVAGHIIVNVNNA
jgi:hypothetical protein